MYTDAKRPAKLVDQLKRASTSITLNIAEGAGKVSKAEAAHHYAIARGSAMECSAILDVLRILESTKNDKLDEGDLLLVRIVAMLTKMCR